MFNWYNRGVELERDLEAYLNKRCKALGHLLYKMVPTKKGLPDRILITRLEAVGGVAEVGMDTSELRVTGARFKGGDLWFLELKVSGGRLSPAQEVQHQRLRRHGQRVAVLYGREQIDEFLRGLD